MSKATDFNTHAQAGNEMPDILADSKSVSPARRPSDVAMKPHIRLEPGSLFATVEAAGKALAATSSPAYRFGGRLGRIVPSQGRSKYGKATFQPYTLHSLRLVLSSVANWEVLRPGRSGVLVPGPSNPPKDIAATLLDEPGAAEVPELLAITRAPVLLNDGRVIQTPGFDGESGIYYAPGVVRYATIPESVSRDEALHALQVLQDPMADFPFENPASRSAAVAAILTCANRHAIDGPVPAIVVNARSARTGKGLLADLIALSGLGEALSPTGEVDEAELEKRIVAALNAGRRALFLDNLSRPFGTPALDAYLTSPGNFMGRLLGASVEGEWPARMIIFASGNNVRFRGDTALRSLVIMLKSDLEKPEERTGFRHPRLRSHVASHWSEYVVAAITLCKAYIDAGRPEVEMPERGSFEDWSRLVRGALVWLGEPDPILAQEAFRDEADEGRNQWRTVLQALRGCSRGNGFTANDIVKGGDFAPVRDVLSLVISREPNAKNVGALLGKHKDAWTDGLRLENVSRANDGFVWRVTARVSSVLETGQSDAVDLASSQLA
jgi:hypothetical protein